MSPGLVKMWVALTGMALMFIAVFSIYFSRYKLKNKFFKAVLAIIAYICMIVAGFIIVLVVFSGPVQE
jgi:predicted membrane-bound spermidine synthase